MRMAAALLLAALAGCAGDGRRPDTCTLGTDAARAQFVAEMKALGAKSTRDDLGLHVSLSGDRGQISAFVHQVAARESTCCRFLKFRVEDTPEVYVLHVLADTAHGSTLDEWHKLISGP